MFRKIPNYDNYIINESGIILDNDKNLVRYTADNDGRLYSTLDGNIEYIDMLVARTFLTRPEHFNYVNHRDNDPLNCHLSNLLWSDTDDSDYYVLQNRSHRKYATRSTSTYQVFNDDESVVIDCTGRGEVAKLIQYEEISLKNMVGNGRKISMGPYKGFQIRRLIL